MRVDSYVVRGHLKTMASTNDEKREMLRRMWGAPVRGENYFKAEITAGRVRTEQTAPRGEFD